MLVKHHGKMSIYEFGKQLLETNDLDPVYVLLHNAQLEPVLLNRWLLSYWCFYHMGTASWISDVGIKNEGAYWDRIETAAGSKDYPRCHERRHFRGANAAKSVAYLRAIGVGCLFQPLLGYPAHQPVTTARKTLKQVMDYVQEWVGFGPWISFKVADMLDRLGLVDVEFDDGAMFLFDSPREGAALLYGAENHPTTSGTVGKWAVDRILDTLGEDMLAPPRYERAINSQEAETILCKWKSYMGGHYHIGEDIEACKNGLMRFPRCKVSQTLLKAGRGIIW